MKTNEILEMVDDDEIDHEAFDYDTATDGLVRYDESAGDNQRWCSITEIVVPTEHDKEQLVKALRYIHNLREIDSDFLAVNTLTHMYTYPDRIKVQP